MRWPCQGCRLQPWEQQMKDKDPHCAPRCATDTVTFGTASCGEARGAQCGHLGLPGGACLGGQAWVRWLGGAGESRCKQADQTCNRLCWTSNTKASAPLGAEVAVGQGDHFRPRRGLVTSRPQPDGKQYYDRVADQHRKYPGAPYHLPKMQKNDVSQVSGSALPCHLVASRPAGWPAALSSRGRRPALLLSYGLSTVLCQRYTFALYCCDLLTDS